MKADIKLSGLFEPHLLFSSQSPNFAAEGRGGGTFTLVLLRTSLVIKLQLKILV